MVKVCKVSTEIREYIDMSIPTHPVNTETSDVTYKVTEIGEEAFMGDPITSICLPNTITVIRARAFKNCSSLATMTQNPN